MGILILFIVIIAVATIDVKTRGIEKARPKKKKSSVDWDVVAMGVASHHHCSK